LARAAARLAEPRPGGRCSASANLLSRVALILRTSSGPTFGGSYRDRHGHHRLLIGARGHRTRRRCQSECRALRGPPDARKRLSPISPMLGSCAQRLSDAPAGQSTAQPCPALPAAWTDCGHLTSRNAL
jgi:hypothetical protein